MNIQEGIFNVAENEQAPKGMTGAELKVALQALGLPPSWFAEHMRVTMRTVVRWFDGTAVSSDIAVAVDALSDQALAEMRKMVKAAGNADPVTLHTYRTDGEFKAEWPDTDKPASWHRALTFRVMEHLKAEGKIVNVEYK